MLSESVRLQTLLYTFLIGHRYDMDDFDNAFSVCHWRIPLSPPWEYEVNGFSVNLRVPISELTEGLRAAVGVAPSNRCDRIDDTDPRRRFGSFPNMEDSLPPPQQCCQLGKYAIPRRGRHGAPAEGWGHLS